MPVWALLALATATFMSVTIEMMPSGLMHLMSQELGVEHAQIGNLVAIFALTVVVTSTPLVLLLARVPKRILLMLVLTLFALGTIFTAFAPNYAMVVVSRILTGIAHGVFWSTVASYTATIVTPQQLMKAVSITSGGGSLAFVFGMPIGTFLGQALGWRTAFAALAVGCLVVVVILMLVLPSTGVDEESAPTGALDTEAVALALSASQHRLRLVVFVCVLTAVVMSAQYAFYSYTAPFLLDVVGVVQAQLPTWQFGYGIAAAIGTATTGILFSARPRIGFYVTAALMLFGAGALALMPETQLAALVGFVVWGAGMGFMPVLLQSRLLAVASPKQRDFAAALFNTGFNIGISSGSFVGGVLLTDYGLRAPGMALIALLIVAVLMAVVLDVRLAVREQAQRP